jgi:rhodanese-related sulfurtransferase
MATEEQSAAQLGTQLPKGKQTSLGLYVTSKQAYEMWKADPERIKVLDVRTFEEYLLIGHAEMATNIPLAFPTYTWDANKGTYSVVPNADFVARVKAQFKPGDTLLVTCRSGGRSALAVNIPAKEGFQQVYNITDGFEGDKVEDPESVYHGKRMKNGWKNSAPWTYDLDPALVWIPTGVELETLRTTLDV